MSEINKDKDTNSHDECEEREIFPGVYMTDYRSGSNKTMEENRLDLDELTQALSEEELAKLSPEELIEKLNELEVRAAQIKSAVHLDHSPFDGSNDTMVQYDTVMAGSSSTEILHQMEFDLHQIELMIKQLVYSNEEMAKALAIDPTDDIIKESIEENIPIIKKKQLQCQKLKAQIDSLGKTLFPTQYPKYHVVTVSASAPESGNVGENISSATASETQVKDYDATGMFL